MKKKTYRAKQFIFKDSHSYRKIENQILVSLFYWELSQIFFLSQIFLFLTNALPYHSAFKYYVFKEMSSWN